MDGNFVCQGQGSQCATTLTPVSGAHTFQAIDYILDVQGYYAAAQSAPVAITVNAPLPPKIALPSTSLNLRAGQTFQFTASITGATNASVIWSLSPPLGTISSSGLYRAPGGETSPESVTVTATSVADPQVSAQSTVHLGVYLPQKMASPSTRGALLGVTDWGGLYRLSSQGTQLEEEALKIQTMNVPGIYSVLAYNYQANYLNSNFGSPINSLRDLAKSPAYVNVFHQSFKNYALAVYSFSNQNYLTTPNLSGEYQEIYDLTTYLLQTYANTGKTFIIKNWEGDNALAELENCDQPKGCQTSPDFLNFTPHPSDLQNMIDWVNTRQEAINDARQAVGATGVQVLQAVEFNLVSRAQSGLPSVLSTVIPAVDCDLISYSSYQSINGPESTLRSQILSDMSFVQNFAGMHGRQLMIGEFGWPNNAPGFTDADIRTDIASQAFMDAGVVLANYWALYDNGTGLSLIDGSGQTTPAGFTIEGLENANSPQITNTTANANALTSDSVIQLGVTAPVSQVFWAVEGEGAVQPAMHAAASASAYASAYSGNGLVRLQTTTPQLDLKPLGLAAGTYHVQVFVQDTSGNISAPTGFDVVLVNAITNAGDVPRFPEPLESDDGLKQTSHLR